ncbi:hypothetical protein ATO13_19845 [Stappia sp. 22II-S9-Z10]|nr:hypothetical protein ATO13_19845 [Stappia sp. 22II-S9-Z10]
MDKTSSSAAAPAAPVRPTFTMWLNASVSMLFVAVMVLPAEAATAWLGGAFTHSPLVGWAIAAVTILPSLAWLCGRGLKNALSAEAELIAQASPTAR